MIFSRTTGLPARSEILPRVYLTRGFQQGEEGVRAPSPSGQSLYSYLGVTENSVPHRPFPGQGAMNTLPMMIKLLGAEPILPLKEGYYHERRALIRRDALGCRSYYVLDRYTAGHVDLEKGDGPLLIQRPGKGRTDLQQFWQDYG